LKETGSYKPITNHLFFAFNNPTYYPGKPVDGVIVLVIQNPIKITKIGITWKGVEYVSWYQGVSQQEHCTAMRNIFETDFTVWAEEKDQFDVGTHTFNYSWKLPDCSANFEEPIDNSGDVIPFLFSTSGMPRTLGDIPSYIRYYATAYADFTLKTDEPTHLRMLRENGFKVAEAFDPKIIVQPPIIKKDSISFWLGGSPLEISISVANGGVLFAGQNLYLNVNAQNKSLRNVDSITFILVEYLTFSAPNSVGQDQSFDRKREILHAEVADSQIPSGGHFHQDLMFTIPHGTPPTILKATHIKRQFELFCQLGVSFVGSNPQVSVPIRILDWSPLLKDDVPKHVPITTKVVTEDDSKV